MPPAALPLNDLVERLLRRVALGGTRHRGTALLEVGAGALRGAAISVTAEGNSLRIEVDAPEDAALASWKHDLETRLRGRGFDVEVSSPPAR